MSAVHGVVDRADLERMDRDALIARAERAGVTRARVLTRPELVDELILRSAVDHDAKQRSRGLFGRARDLLARVVERGLHLPDAADRIRSVGGALPTGRPSAPAALPTVTLAEIYAAQGHRARAVETLERVLVREPDHAAARTLLAQLDDARFPVPAPRLSPENEEETEPTESSAVPDVAARSLETLDARDDGRPPEVTAPTRHEVDECVAIPIDPSTLYVCWEVSDHVLESIQATRPSGTVALRLVVVVATWDGPRSSVRDHDVGASAGHFFARDLPAGSVVRVAIGFRHGETFVPLAHSPALESPAPSEAHGAAGPLVRRTPRGGVPVSQSDPDAPAIERALYRARQALAGSALS